MMWRNINGSQPKYGVRLGWFSHIFGSKNLVKYLSLVVFRSGKFFMRNITIFVLIFVAKDLFYEFILIFEHLLSLLGLLTSSLSHSFNLLFEVYAQLLSGQG